MKPSIRKNFYTVIITLLISSNLHAQEFPNFSWYRAKDTLVYQKGEKQFHQGNFPQALLTLKKLPSRLYDKDPGLLRLLGQCYVGLKEHQKAVELFSKSLLFNPEITITYYDRGYSLMEQEKYKAAASDFAGFAIHYPQNKSAALNLAYCLAMDNQIDAAIQYLERFEPKDTTIYLYIGNYYSDFKEDHEKAIQYYNKTLAYDSSHVQALEYISISYSLINNYKQAINSINKLIIINPDYGRAYYLRGFIEEQFGLDGEAQKSYNIAKEKGYIWDEEEDIYDDEN